jgi:itaconate CoA-transferase
VPALLPPGRDDGRMDAVPALGQHTAAILAELGLAPELIEQLMTHTNTP